MPKQPQNFTVRAGSKLPGRVRRHLDAAIDTDRRNGHSLDVIEGRLDVKIAPGQPFEVSRDGLKFTGQMGEQNRAQMRHIADPPSGASAADLRMTLIEVLGELRRTKRLKGQVS